MTKHQPATPRWKLEQTSAEHLGAPVKFIRATGKDAEDLVHAANAYPLLVELFKLQVRRANGEAHLSPEAMQEQIEALLRSLGEAE